MVYYGSMPEMYIKEEKNEYPSEFYEAHVAAPSFQSEFSDELQRLGVESERIPSVKFTVFYGKHASKEDAVVNLPPPLREQPKRATI